MESASRLKSSIIFNVRIVLPLAKVSCIKSKLQVMLGPTGQTKGAFTRAGRRFFRCSSDSDAYCYKSGTHVCDSTCTATSANDGTSSRIPRYGGVLLAWRVVRLPRYHPCVSLGSNKQKC